MYTATIKSKCIYAGLHDGNGYICVVELFLTITWSHYMRIYSICLKAVKIQVFPLPHDVTSPSSRADMLCAVSGLLVESTLFLFFTISQFVYSGCWEMIPIVL